MAAIFTLRRGVTNITLAEAELYLHQGNGTIQFGSGSNAYNLLPLNAPAYGDINLVGSISASGDVRIGGNIYLGNASVDNISALGQFNTNLIPNGTIDIGSPSAPWTNVYATNISASSFTGTIGGIDITIFSQSVDSRIDNLEFFTGSQNTKNTNLATYTSSVDSKFGTLETYTSSVDSRLTNLELDSASQDARLDLLEIATGSNTSRLDNLESKSASVDISVSQLNLHTQSLNNWTGSTFQPFSTSVDSRLHLLQHHSQSLNNWTGSIFEPFSTSVDIRLDVLEATASLYVPFSASVDSRLDILENASSSNDGRLDNLELYTQSLNAAIELTGSTVSFLGNIVVYGTQSVINSVNLEVADNMIYLNATSSTTNVDLGVVGNYNDGTYAHTGIYRDSSDGVWRVFKGYTPEPSGNIDLTHASYKYADFYANEISASSLVGIGNVTTYSASVNSRLKIVEASASLYINFSESVDLRLAELELTSSYLREDFSSSVDSRLTNLEGFSGSVNTKLSTLSTYTSSIDTKWSTLENVTASLLSFTQSQETKDLTLAAWTGSIDTKWNSIQNVTASLLSFTASQETKDLTLATWTGSTDNRLNNLELSSASVNGHIADINLWTSSINTKQNIIESVTSSLYNWSGSINTKHDTIAIVTASLNTHTGSVNNRLSLIEIQTASFITFTGSIYQPFSTSVDYRLDELEYTTSVNLGNGAQVALLALNQFTQSQETKNSTLATYTASVNNQLTELFNTASNHEGRIDTLELFSSSLDASFVTEAELTVFSSSVDNRLVNLQLNSASVSSSILNLNLFTSSINTTIKGQLNANTVVSGSSQISYVGLSGIPSGIVSGAAQLTPLLPTGTVSGSSQVLGGTNIHSGSTGNYQFNSIGVGSTTTASGVDGEIRAQADIIAFYSSDKRLKENINPITDALAKVEAISGNTYDWKEGFENIHSHKGNDVGVIAQEIEKILPQAVINRDNGYKAVDYEKIVPLLIEAIKELSQKVKDLEKN